MSQMPLPSTDADSPVFIDVRSRGEYARGCLEGAVNLPLDELLDGIARVTPDPGRELVLYCASGARSAMACAALQQLGYRKVRNGGGVGVLALTAGKAVVRPAC